MTLFIGLRTATEFTLTKKQKIELKVSSDKGLTVDASALFFLYGDNQTLQPRVD